MTADDGQAPGESELGLLQASYRKSVPGTFYCRVPVRGDQSGCRVVAEQGKALIDIHIGGMTACDCLPILLLDGKVRNDTRKDRGTLALLVEGPALTTYWRRSSRCPALSEGRGPCVLMNGTDGLLGRLRENSLSEWSLYLICSSLLPSAL